MMVSPLQQPVEAALQVEVEVDQATLQPPSAFDALQILDNNIPG